MSRLYASVDRTRFFVVPADVELRPGDLPVQGLDGKSARVDGTQLGAYEVPEETARAEVARQRQAAAELVRELNALAASVEGIGRELGRPLTPERVGAFLQKHGMTEDDLARDPEGVMRKLVAELGEAARAGLAQAKRRREP